MFKVERLFRAVIRNAAVLLSGKAANAVLTLAAMGLAARGLGLNEFGVLILVHAFAKAVGEVAKFQSWQVVVHYGAKPLGESRLADFQRVLRFSAVLDAISAVGGVSIAMAGALIAGPWLKWPEGTAPLAVAYASSVIFMVSATSHGVLRLFGRFDLIAGQTTTASLIWLIGSAAAYVLHGGLAAYLAVWWAGTFMAFVVLFGAAARELTHRGTLKGADWFGGRLTHGMPGVWRFALTTNATATLDLGFTHISTLMVGGLLNPANAALWNIAKLVGDAIAEPAKMVVPALYPELARLRAAGDHHTLARLGARVMLAVGALATALLAVTMLLGGPALGLVLGKAFAAAGPVMTWQVAAAAIGIWALPLEPMLISTGRAGVALTVRTVAVVLYLVALTPLIERMGLIGAGVASVGAATLMGAGMLIGVLQWYRDPATGLVRPAPPPDAFA